jgi:hypothetical protein
MGEEEENQLGPSLEYLRLGGEGPDEEIETFDF